MKGFMPWGAGGLAGLGARSCVQGADISEAIPAAAAKALGVSPGLLRLPRAVGCGGN